MDLLRSPATNKDLCFSAEERSAHAVDALLPRGEPSDMRMTDSLDKYVFLTGLAERDRDLFFAAAAQHTSTIMPLVYTPTIGTACTHFSDLVIPRRGMFISLADRGLIRQKLDQWPVDDVKAVVMTDGERILGLGDLGANGMGIPIGKLALYTVCAGVHPDACLPVTFDVGTNNEKLLTSPTYIGVRSKRTTGAEYDELIAEFIDAAKAKYGESVLLQFEDFGNHNAFRLLNEYKLKACVFNDDIQGTASVVLAGLLASARVTGRALHDERILFLGAGEAGVGIADLISYSISQTTGVSIDDARRQISLVDSRGLVTEERLGSLQRHKRCYAHPSPAKNSEPVSFEAAVDLLRPTVLISVSAVANSFTQPIIERMNSHCARPVVFALSNPTSKAECTAEQAYTWSKGQAIFASGSPFDKVTLGTQVFVPGQGNNAYIFPGVALGLIAAKATRASDHTFFIAAKSLANQVAESQLTVGCMYPPLSEIRSVSAVIAAEVLTEAVHTGVAGVAMPADPHAAVQAIMYKP